MSLRAIKAVAVDVDGTLLDSDHRLREAVKDALCNLAANDIRVVLATARGPKESYKPQGTKRLEATLGFYWEPRNRPKLAWFLPSSLLILYRR